MAKFQKIGNDKRLYESVADSFIDSSKGAGWKIYTRGKNKLKEEVFCRNDLGDILLELLKEIKII